MARSRRSGRHIHWNIPGIIVVVIALLMAGGFVAWYRDWKADIARTVAEAQNAPVPKYLRPTKAPDPTVVLVMGDSFTGGSDMNRGPTWPTILGDRHGWLMQLDGVGGSGYTEDGQGESFPKRATSDGRQYAADLIIVAGGLNDEFVAGDKGEQIQQALPPILANARTTIRRLRKGNPSGDILLLSPFANGNSRPTLDAIAAGLRGVAKEAGVKYLDVTGFLAGPRARFIGSDGTHPTDAGHHLLAKEFDAALKRLGLPRPHAFQRKD